MNLYPGNTELKAEMPAKIILRHNKKIWIIVEAVKQVTIPAPSEIKWLEVLIGGDAQYQKYKNEGDKISETVKMNLLNKSLDFGDNSDEMRVRCDRYVGDNLESNIKLVKMLKKSITVPLKFVFYDMTRNRVNVILNPELPSTIPAE